MCSLIARETESLQGEHEALMEALQRHYLLNSHSIAYLAASVNSLALEHSQDALQERVIELVAKAKVTIISVLCRTLPRVRLVRHLPHVLAPLFNP